MAGMLHVLVDPAHLLHIGHGAGLLVNLTTEAEDWLYRWIEVWL